MSKKKTIKKHKIPELEKERLSKSLKAVAEDDAPELGGKLEQKVVIKLPEKPKRQKGVTYRMAIRPQGDYEVQCRKDKTDAWTVIGNGRNKEECESVIASMREPFIEL